MYIEIVDETNAVSADILTQTETLLQAAADRLEVSKSKEMAVTFVDNARSHALNLEYRDTDRATDVISLEYKPEEYGDLPAELLREMGDELDPFIGELFISADKAAEQAADFGHSLAREYGWLAVHGFLHINGYDHYTPDEEKEMFALTEEILTNFGLTR
ncbi:MAG: rRNA maturation RNase YbeY [Streptococcaceae bacterium]|jgi:probable rRNA maturation factor|nr:rRNA maturation RNase YbeY [Streptococcaceae bacterium]